MEEKEMKIVELRNKILKNRNEYIKNKKQINLEDGKYYDDIVYMFVIEEIVNFLHMEIFSMQAGLKSKLNLEEYKILLNIENIDKEIIEIYYDTEFGASYEDLLKILKLLVEERG